MRIFRGDVCTRPAVSIAGSFTLLVHLPGTLRYWHDEEGSVKIAAFGIGDGEKSWEGAQNSSLPVIITLLC